MCIHIKNACEASISHAEKGLQKGEIDFNNQV